MLKQSINDVSIEGILYEIDVEPRVDTKGRNYVSGTITVRVEQEISGETTTNDIPVRVFSYQDTKAGGTNPSYRSIIEMTDEGISIAATGGDEDAATKVRVGGARLSEQQFQARDGEKISYTAVQGSFFNKVTKELNPSATFEIEVLIKNIEKEVKNDEETGRLIVYGVTIQYGEIPDIIKFVVENPEAVDYISSYWSPEDTVRLTGLLRHTVSTMEVEAAGEVAFGEPLKKTRDTVVREFVITSGSNPMDKDVGYSVAEVVQALTRKEQAYEAKYASQDKAEKRGF